MMSMTLHTIGLDHTWAAANKDVLCSLLQGTILGPLLFIYIHQQLTCLSNSEPRMYADDTHIAFSSNNIQNINMKILLELKKA